MKVKNVTVTMIDDNGVEVKKDYDEFVMFGFENGNLVRHRTCSLIKLCLISAFLQSEIQNNIQGGRECQTSYALTATPQ